MKLGYVAIPAAALSLISMAPAQAQQAPTVSNQHAAILAGDYSGAERRLIAASAMRPDNQEILLNLATVKLMTRQFAQARQLYMQVLQTDDIRLDVNKGRVMTAHQVARRGLELVAQATAR